MVPIAFDCSAGIRHLIAPSGTNGVLIPAFDMDEYARQLARLMDDKGLRLRIQDQVLKKPYPLEIVGKGYFQLYESLLQS